MGGNRVGGQLLGFFRQRVLDGELDGDGGARSLDALPLPVSGYTCLAHTLVGCPRGAIPTLCALSPRI